MLDRQGAIRSGPQDDPGDILGVLGDGESAQFLELKAEKRRERSSHMSWGPQAPYLLGPGSRQVETRALDVAPQLRERQHQQVGVPAGGPRSREQGHEPLHRGDVCPSRHTTHVVRFYC